MKIRIASTLAGMVIASLAHADPSYSISTPDAALTGMVSGSAVTLRLAAPSSALLKSATLKLNGVDVTSQVHADGAGSMSGVVSGLQPGANRFQLWSKNSAEPVAKLTVMKAQQEIVASGSRFQAVPGPYTGLGSAPRSRPLCPYPKTLRYNGAGDISQAASYACQ